MELSLKRVAFAALLMAAVLLPLRKPAKVPVTRMTNDQLARYDTLAWRYHTAHVAWSAFDLRDSALTVLGKLHDTAAQPTVAWRGFGDAPDSPMADSIIQGLWHRIGKQQASVRTAVLIYNAQAYPTPRYEGALVIHDAGQTSCVAMVPGHLTSNGEASISEYELEEPIAPCALLAAFGPPGTGVGTWLATTRFAAAQSNRWLWPKPTQNDWHPGAPWVEWQNSVRSDSWFNNVPRWVITIGALEVGANAVMPYMLGGSGLHCIAGEQEACLTGVLHPALRFPPSNAMPFELTQEAARSTPDAITVETVRPPTRGFVASLITEFGRDKFQRFWSSDLPFEQAFQAAFGEALGEWTARWSRQSWLASPEARYMSADITLGVTLKPSWLLLTAVWSAVAVAVAGRVAQRRTA